MKLCYLNVFVQLQLEKQTEVLSYERALFCAN